MSRDAADATGRFADQVAEATGGVTAMAAAAAPGVMRPAAELTEHHLGWAFTVDARAVSPLAARLAPRPAVAAMVTGTTVVPDGNRHPLL